jgi:hypothetical protein
MYFQQFCRTISIRRLCRMIAHKIDVRCPALPFSHQEGLHQYAFVFHTEQLVKTGFFEGIMFWR